MRSFVFQLENFCEKKWIGLRINTVCRAAWYCIPLVIIVNSFSSVGCDIVAQYESSSIDKNTTYNKYDCKVSLRELGSNLAKVNINVMRPSGSSGNNLKNCYAVFSPIKGDANFSPFTENTEPYCDKNWSVKNIGKQDLKNSYWVRSADKDALNSSSTFMQMGLDTTQIEAIYIAADARFQRSPQWLELYYDMQPDSSAIEIGKPDGLGGLVKLRIWKKKVISSPLILPGNTIEYCLGTSTTCGDGWFNGITDPAMYLVFIKPKPISASTIPKIVLPEEDWPIYKLHTIGNEESEGNYSNLICVEQKAIELCKDDTAKKVGSECFEATCAYQAECHKENKDCPADSELVFCE